MIAPTVSIGARPHRVRYQNPTPPVADGLGSYTESWLDVGDAFVQIRPASGQDLERAQSTTVASTATHLITGPFVPQVSTLSRVLLEPRTVDGELEVSAIYSVLGVASPDLRGIEMVLYATEVVL